jgi:hypothetical protein
MDVFIRAVCCSISNSGSFHDLLKLRSERNAPVKKRLGPVVLCDSVLSISGQDKQYFYLKELTPKVFSLESVAELQRSPRC